MRAKTLYENEPSPFEIKDGDEGRKIICFRENIEEIIDTEETEEGTVERKHYEADEYEITVPVSQSLPKRIEDNYGAWLERARQDDYNRAAKEVRAKRAELLQASDYIQLADYPATPEEREAWQEYRQALRDITEQAGFPYDVTFPTEPSI